MWSTNSLGVSCSVNNVLTYQLLLNLCKSCFKQLGAGTFNITQFILLLDTDMFSLCREAIIV